MENSAETEPTLGRGRLLTSRTAVTAVVAALAGFLFVASSVTSAGTNLRTGGIEDLRRYIIDRAQTVGNLQTRVSTQQQAVDDLSKQNLPADLQTKLASLDQAVGLTVVTGSALSVTLDDAPRAAGAPLPEGVSPDDLVVHQQDVQAVVNAFWRSGATAIQVMDQRIISTSAIRCVGNTLLLQGRVYSPPFKITAIGDVNKLQAGLDTEPGVQVYRQYVAKLNLGWKVSINNDASIGPWQGALTK